MFRVIVSKRAAVAVGKKGYRKQAVGIFLIDKDGVEDEFPSRIDVLRGPDERDYPPGEYAIHPSSFAVSMNEFGSAQLGLGFLSLSPVVPKVAEAKRA